MSKEFEMGGTTPKIPLHGMIVKRKDVSSTLSSNKYTTSNFLLTKEERKWTKHC